MLADVPMKAIHQCGSGETCDSEPFELADRGRRDAPVGPDYFELLVIDGGVRELVGRFMIDSEKERESGNRLDPRTALNLSAVGLGQRVEHPRLAVTDKPQG